MEGNEEQRRKAARRARDHREKVETIHEGKQMIIGENVPETRPGYGSSARTR